ncbi:unnamed protein product, partial [Clonostachys rosea f. rosea IK726]
MIAMKILGTGSSRGFSIDQCLKLGRAVNDQTVTIGSSFDHCHVPGRRDQAILDDICVLGASIHNHAGWQRISPFPSVGDLIRRALRLLCDPADTERAFATFTPGAQVTLLINNYGGLCLSHLELGELADETLGQLSQGWSITPVRSLIGTFETSLNASGFSISLYNITVAARNSESGANLVLELLDSHTTAMMLRSACARVIAAEPKLTEWDLVMGDEDYGEAVKGLAELVLTSPDSGSTKSGSVVGALRALIQAAEDVGGTLGTIFGILLSALFASLKAAIATQAKRGSGRGKSPLFSSTLSSAVECLKLHTSVREGDRTVMDVLLPFANSFSQKEAFTIALKVTKEKAEGAT